MTTSATQLTGTDLLRQRHEQIKQLFTETLNAPADQRQESFDCLRATLAVHETVEEMFVHPLARDWGDEASRIVDALLEEEARATKALAELEDLGVDGDQFAIQLTTFQREVLAHAEAEETRLFPLIETNLTPDDLIALADTLIVDEQLAPTHPHPHASQNPSVLMLTGPFVAMVDKARDHFKKLRVD